MYSFVKSFFAACIGLQFWLFISFFSCFCFRLFAFGVLLCLGRCSSVGVLLGGPLRFFGLVCGFWCVLVHVLFPCVFVLAGCLFSFGYHKPLMVVPI